LCSFFHAHTPPPLPSELRMSAILREDQRATALAFSPDSRALAVGFWHGAVHVFRLTRDGAWGSEPPLVLEGAEKHPVTTSPGVYLAWLPDSRVGGDKEEDGSLRRE
jgi:hypothetical protein